MDRYAFLLDGIRAELDGEDEVDLLGAARDFLARLDPHSQEGMWFDALAERYPSREAAASAYLTDVKRTSRSR